MPKICRSKKIIKITVNPNQTFTRPSPAVPKAAFTSTALNITVGKQDAVSGTHIQRMNEYLIKMIFNNLIFKDLDGSPVRWTVVIKNCVYLTGQALNSITSNKIVNPLTKMIIIDRCCKITFLGCTKISKSPQTDSAICEWMKARAPLGASLVRYYNTSSENKCEWENTPTRTSMSFAICWLLALLAFMRCLFPRSLCIKNDFPKAFDNVTKIQNNPFF